MSVKYTTAVIAGSFDPITFGHTDLVLRAAEIFPRIIIAVSQNTEKKYFLPYENRFNAVKAVFLGHSNVEVQKLCGLLADFVKSKNAVLVKGARNSIDFEYEKTLYDINNSLENIETIILPARKELAYISSTFARDMIKFNRPLNGIVPPEAIEFIVKAL